MRCASLRAKPAAQGKRTFFLYPALTSQPVRKRPPWLNVLGYFRPPLRGWCLVRLIVTAPIFIPLGTGHVLWIVLIYGISILA
jgi:hypothetical protein